MKYEYAKISDAELAELNQLQAKLSSSDKQVVLLAVEKSLRSQSFPRKNWQRSMPWRRSSPAMAGRSSWSLFPADTAVVQAGGGIVAG